MKLKSYRVRNFKSIIDSGNIEVDDSITCLVGQNESGKTVLLEALYRANPVKSEDSVFNEDCDYPKRNIKSRKARDSASSDDEPVVECSYELEEDDIKEVSKVFGDRVITGKLFKRKTYYNGRPELSSDDIEVDEQAAKANLADKAKQSQEANRLHSSISGFQGQDFSNYILEQTIWPRAPKFFYIDDYPQLDDHVNLNNLAQQGYSDHLIVSFMKLAELEYELIASAKKKQELENNYGKHEGLKKASNKVTSKVLKHWSQNSSLQVNIDIGFAGEGDPEEMRNVPNIWINVYDDNSKEDTRLSSRSKGFLWFFPFLYSMLLLNNNMRKLSCYLMNQGYTYMVMHRVIYLKVLSRNLLILRSSTQHTLLL